MGFSRQEYWSGLPFPSPGDLPDPGTEPRSPALQAGALPSELLGEPVVSIVMELDLSASLLALIIIWDTWFRDMGRRATMSFACRVWARYHVRGLISIVLGAFRLQTGDSH